MYNEEVINKIKDILVARGETLACAESVTSGNLQVAFSQAIEASNFFQGGMTVYNLGQKTRQLNIEPILATKVNSVAEAIAETLALEISIKFLSNFGIGITGYSTLVPECEKEGIFAYISIAHNREIVITKKITSSKEGTLPVQIDYTNQALQNLLNYLEGLPLK